MLKCISTWLNTIIRGYPTVLGSHCPCWGSHCLLGQPLSLLGPGTLLQPPAAASTAEWVLYYSRWCLGTSSTAVVVIVQVLNGQLGPARTHHHDRIAFGARTGRILTIKQFPRIPGFVLNLDEFQKGLEAPLSTICRV